MGLFSSIGSLFNGITSPLGIQLFPGGPYQDNGAGNTATTYQTPAANTYNNVSQTGQNLAQNEQNIQPALAQYAQASGLGNMFGNAPETSTIQNQPDYGLNQEQQQYLNQQVAGINSQRSQALSQYQAQMAQSGIDDPEALAAGEQYIHENYNNRVNQLTTQFAQAANQQKIASSMNLAQMLAGLTQQGTGTQMQGAEGLTNLDSIMRNQAQSNISNMNNNVSQIGSLLGGMGGGLFGGSSIPAMSATTGSTPAWMTSPSLQG